MRHRGNTRVACRCVPEAAQSTCLPPRGTPRPIADCVFALIFWGNWILLLANLLPVFPLDGIRMVLAVLKNRTDVESAAETAIRISFVAAGLIMLVGLFVLDSAWIVFFGALAMFLSLVEWFQMRTADTAG